MLIHHSQSHLDSIAPNNGFKPRFKPNQEVSVLNLTSEHNGKKGKVIKEDSLGADVQFEDGTTASFPTMAYRTLIPFWNR